MARVPLAAGLALMLVLAVAQGGDATKPRVIETTDVLVIEATGLKKGPGVHGECLVRPDGTLSLGEYGSVTVLGLWLQDARAAIVKALTPQAGKGKLEVQVSFRPDRHYRVVRQTQISTTTTRLNWTGNETVVDAFAHDESLPRAAAHCHVWLERSYGTMLKVDWKAITRTGSDATNYKLEPGDKVYVSDTPPK